MKKLIIIGLVMFVLPLTGCGNDRSDLRDEIAGEMMRSSQGAIEQADAHCFADALIDAMGVEQARLYFRATSGDMEAAQASEPLTDEQQQKLAEGIMACGPGATFVE